MAKEEKVGSTLQFVNAQGFETNGPFTVLIGFDRTQRLFAELTADSDRPDVRPADAYAMLFHSIQPGWTLRILQIFMHDVEPRAAFMDNVQHWNNRTSEGLRFHHKGLVQAIDGFPLPFLSRTYLEFVLPGPEGIAWWEGLPGVLFTYGVNVKYLQAPEITTLARRILNPGMALPETVHSDSAYLPAAAQDAKARADDYKRSVAPEALELADDYVLFPETALLPISGRGGGTPGMQDRPWSRVGLNTFITGAPAFYSLSVRREPPDIMRTNLRARRTLSEGFLNALSIKTGRRPSMAEGAQNVAMDAAESSLAMGKPFYRGAFLTALVAPRDQLEGAMSARRTIESKLRAAGLLPQKLHHVPELVLSHLQPGGDLIPKIADGPTLFYEEFAKLIPMPTRRTMPVKDAVWLGRHGRDGRDVHFSYAAGLDPGAPPPAHSITLILGEMGSGKTTLLRWMMLQRLLQGRTVLSIDPEGENNRLCQVMGGVIIPAGIPADRDTCLLHPLQAETSQDMLLAARFLVATLSGRDALAPETQAVLHEAVKRRWDRNPGSMTVTDLVETLGTINDPNAGTPMALLRPYMAGGLWDGFFDRPKALLGTNLAAGQWLNFDLSTLREENKGVIHAILAWFLYHVVTVGKTAMDIYIDEGWRLLRSGPFADLLDELGRRARKRDIGVTLLTHMPQDLVKNPSSLSMASTAFVGRIGPDEAFAFFRSMGVPEADAQKNASMVSQLPPRVFMAVPSGGRGALFPVQVMLPPAWLEFWERQGVLAKKTVG